MRSEHSTHHCLATLGAQPRCRSGSRQAGWLSAQRHHSFHKHLGKACFMWAEICWEAERWVIFPFLSPFLVLLSKKSHPCSPLKAHSTLHPSVISLCLTLAYLWQISPAGVLHRPALSSPNPVFLPDPSLFLTMSLLFAQSLHVLGCLLPCFPPQGRLHLHFSLEASSTPLPILSDGSRGSTGVFFFSVDVLAAVVALGSWDQQFQGNSYWVFVPLQWPFPSVGMLGALQLTAFYCVNCTHWGDMWLVLCLFFDWVLFLSFLTVLSLGLFFLSP